MKKGKIMAIALAVAVTFMGSGYAYWAQDLTFNANVDTGILEVDFVEPIAVEEENSYQPAAEAKVNEYADIMTINWEDVYPGVKNRLEFKLSNVGTLAAFVDDFKITSDTDNITGLILCSSVKVQGSNKTYSGTTLADALDYLNSLYSDQGIRLENEGAANAIKKVELMLQFSPDATDITFAQDSDFTFNMTASVYQFNDTTSRLVP